MTLLAFLFVAGTVSVLLSVFLDPRNFVIPTSLMVVMWLLVFLPAIILALLLVRALAAVMWPCDLTIPTDRIWIVPDFSDPSLDPPPGGRVEPALDAKGLDGPAEPARVAGVTGGRAESGEA